MQHFEAEGQPHPVGCVTMSPSMDLVTEPAALGAATGAAAGFAGTASPSLSVLLVSASLSEEPLESLLLSEEPPLEPLLLEPLPLPSLSLPSELESEIYLAFLALLTA